MPTVAWYAFSAWFVSGVCVVLAMLRVRRAARLRPPASERLLSELLSENEASESVSERTRQIAIAALNERLSDVEFELSVLPARLIALTRISFASGTGLALFGYIGASESSAMIRVLGFASCIGAGGPHVERRAAAARRGRAAPSARG